MEDDEPRLQNSIACVPTLAAPHSKSSNTPTCIVTGGSGLLGSALRRIVESDYSAIFDKYQRSSPRSVAISSAPQPPVTGMKFIWLSSKDCDLRDYDKADEIFGAVHPTHCVHLAARVGGLFANMTNNIEFFRQNFAINDNIIRLCHKHSINRAIFCLSTCIFPQDASLPLTEECIHLGPPHDSNEGYATAKRVLEMMVRFYVKAFKYEWLCVIPTNLYGPFDNFNLNEAHVLPALMHRCHISKKDNKDHFQVLGSGAPYRQFLFSQDAGRILLAMLICPWERFRHTLYILSGDERDSELTICDAANLIKEVSNFQGYLEFDKSKADGIFRKSASNRRLKEFLGPNFKFVSLREGFETTYTWLRDNYDSCRR